MTLFSLKLLSIILIFLTTISAGIYPFKKRLQTSHGHDFPKAEALACGVFLGAGLIHMLGDAASDFLNLGFDYPFAFLLAGVTFLVLLWLEHLGREYHEHGGKTSAAFAILATVMLSIHSFLAGAALGLSEDIYIAILILIAIVAHKWAASFSLAVEINKSSLAVKHGFYCFLVFVFMTPLGIVVGSTVVHHLTEYPLLQPIFMSLAAGTFLYLGTLHGLAKAVMVQRCCNLKNFTLVILGFALMAIVAIWT